MMLHLGLGGVYRSAQPCVGVGGVWKPVKAMFVGQAGSWKQIHSGAAEPLGCGVIPNESGWTFDGATYIAGPFTCEVVGGTPPYSFSWTADQAAATNSTGETTYFFTSFRLAQFAYFTVTDAAGVQASSFMMINEWP